jgi:hypothetical protein
MTIIMQKILYKTSDENLITYFFQKSDVIVGKKSMYIELGYPNITYY